MKGKRNLLIGVFLGGIIGWSLGFLRVPYLENNFSFLIGFIAGLAFILLLAMIQLVWEKNTSILNWFSKNSETAETTNLTKTYSFIWFLALAFVLLGGFISSFLIFKQNEFSKIQIKNQNQKIAQLSNLIESSRNSNLIVLMNDIFDKIEDELKNNPNRTLSDNTISRITALNYSFKPYWLLEGDSLSTKKWSPERGQLLLTLASMNIDSSSFIQIKNKNSFLGADLRKADLTNLDLSQVDLSNANLKGANLSGTNLNQANLTEANFWGANLKAAKLRGSILHRADFQWANLNEADLRKSNLNGANLNNAKLRKANMRDLNFEWAKARNTSLNEADLSNAKLTGTDFGKSNLSKTNFSGAIMKLVNFSDAILDQTNLSQTELSKATVVEKDWIQNLRGWKVINAGEIENTYKTIVEVSGKYNFRLVKK